MKNLKALAVVLVMVAVGYLTWKLLPPYVGNYNLHQETDNMAMQFTYAQGASPEAITNEVIAKAKAQGEVVLALRSYADAGDRSGRAVMAARQATGDVHIWRGGVMTDAAVTP